MGPIPRRPPPLLISRLSTVSLIAVAAAGEINAFKTYAKVGPETVGGVSWSIGTLLSRGVLRVRRGNISLAPDFAYAEEVRDLALGMARFYPVTVVPRSTPVSHPIRRESVPDDDVQILSKGRTNEIPLFLAAAGVTFQQAIAEALGIRQPDVMRWLQSPDTAVRGVSTEVRKRIRLVFLNPNYFVAREYRALLDAMVDRARPQYRAVAASHRRRWAIFQDPVASEIYQRIMKQRPAL